MAWAPDYLEVEDLRSYEGIPDEEDDAVLGLAIATSSRAIDRHCRRQFGLVAAPETRYYRARYDCRLGWVVDVDDLMTAVGLLVSGVAPAASALAPRNAAAKGRPWTTIALTSRPTGDVEAVGQWGWSAFPDAVKQGCLLQSSRLVMRRSAPFGIAGSPDSGSEMRLLAKVDPDVAVSLDDYRRRARPQ